MHVCVCVCVCVHVSDCRYTCFDERREGRKEEASKVKQTKRQSDTALYFFQSSQKEQKARLYAVIDIKVAITLTEYQAPHHEVEIHFSYTML